MGSNDCFIRMNGGIGVCKMALGKRLEMARKQREWTQQQLAVAAGMDPDSGRQAIQIVESRDSSRSKYAGAWAKALRISLIWLTDGDGPMELATGGDDNVRALALKGEALKLPLISWVTAGALCAAEDPYAIGDAEAWLLSPFDAEYGDILLMVRGDSMFIPDGTGYGDGEIIHVKPRLDSHHNDDVIVRTPGGETTFKRLKEAPEGKYLVALNPAWPDRIIRVPEGTVICGVVVGSWRSRHR